MTVCTVRDARGEKVKLVWKDEQGHTHSYEHDDLFWIGPGSLSRHRGSDYLLFNPWCNGEYAVKALAWGAIIMLVISVWP
jgi:hypothetical protein